MECYHCKNQYDSECHTPRLLIQCGHSLCTECTIALFSDCLLICPECKAYNYAATVNNFPKNLALLGVKTKPIIQEQPEIQKEVKMDEELCQKHFKVIEAFCEKDKTLLCIDCILEDGHKNHEISSIPNAIEKEKELMTQGFSVCQILSNQILQNLNELKESVASVESQYNTEQSEIKSFFSNIRKQIEDREQQNVKTLDHNFTVIKTCIENQVMVLNKQLESISNYNQEYQQYCNWFEDKTLNKTNVEILRGCTNRIELIVDATKEIPDILTNFRIDALNKETEIHNLIKYLQSVNKAIISISGSNSTCSTEQNSLKSSQTSIASTNNNNNPVKKKSIIQSSIPQQQFSYANNIQKRHKNTSSIMANSQKIAAPTKNFKKNSNDSAKQSQPSPTATTKQTRQTQKNKPAYSRNQKNTEPSPGKLQYPSKTQVYQPGSPTDLTAVDFSLVHNQLSSGVVLLLGGFCDPVDKSSRQLTAFSLANHEFSQIKVAFINNLVKFGVINGMNKVLVVGGKMDGIRSDTMFMLEQGKKQFVKCDQLLPEKMAGSGVVGLGEDKILLCGGNTGTKILAETYLFQKNQWNEPIKMNYARDELALITARDGRVYAFGGYGYRQDQSKDQANCLSSVERRRENGTWEEINKMAVERRAMSAVTLLDGVYVIGGFDGDKYLNSVERFDERTGNWEFVEPMNEPRCTFAVITSQDLQSVYVFGGFNNQPLDSIERYNIVSGKWEFVGRMPNKRFMHQAVLMDDKFIERIIEGN